MLTSQCATEQMVVISKIRERFLTFDLTLTIKLSMFEQKQLIAKIQR